MPALLLNSIGNATFTGKLAEEKITFLKVYDEKATRNGAAAHGVNYEFVGEIESGEEIQGFFKGLFAGNFSGDNNATIKKIL